MDDIRCLLPRHKSDVERAKTLANLGYPAVAPILPELVEWLQDMNWPVAPVVLSILIPIGIPLVPLIRDVLEADDEIWKYWVLTVLIPQSPPLYEALRERVRQIAMITPCSEEEVTVQEAALKVLERYGDAPAAGAG